MCNIVVFVLCLLLLFYLIHACGMPWCLCLCRSPLLPCSGAGSVAGRLRTFRCVITPVSGCFYFANILIKYVKCNFLCFYFPHIYSNDIFVITCILHHVIATRQRCAPGWMEYGQVCDRKGHKKGATAEPIGTAPPTLNHEKKLYACLCGYYIVYISFCVIDNLLPFN